MADITAWNTGCLYTEEGQVILALPLEGQRVAFYDTSRGIPGIIHTGNARVVQEDLKRLVDVAYLHGIYVGVSYQDEAEQEAMIALYEYHRTRDKIPTPRR